MCIACSCDWYHHIIITVIYWKHFPSQSASKVIFLRSVNYPIFEGSLDLSGPGKTSGRLMLHQSCLWYASLRPTKKIVTQQGYRSHFSMTCYHVFILPKFRKTVSVLSTLRAQQRDKQPVVFAWITIETYLNTIKANQRQQEIWCRIKVKA